MVCGLWFLVACCNHLQLFKLGQLGRNVNTIFVGGLPLINEKIYLNVFFLCYCTSFFFSGVDKEAPMLIPIQGLLRYDQTSPALPVKISIPTNTPKLIPW